MERLFHSEVQGDRRVHDATCFLNKHRLQGGGFISCRLEADSNTLSSPSTGEDEGGGGVSGAFTTMPAFPRTQRVPGGRRDSCLRLKAREFDHPRKGHLTRIIHESPETPSPAPSPIEGEGHTSGSPLPPEGEGQGEGADARHESSSRIIRANGRRS